MKPRLIRVAGFACLDKLCPAMRHVTTLPSDRTPLPSDRIQDNSNSQRYRTSGAGGRRTEPVRRDDKKADLIPRSRRLHVHTDLGIAAPAQQAAKDACLMAAAADVRGSYPAACQRQEAALQDAVCPLRLWCLAMASRAWLSSL